MAQTTPMLNQQQAERLAAAVLAAALTDALSGQAEAIYWLLTTDAAFYANLAGRDNSGQLVGVARKCRPGRRILSGRTNPASIGRALYG